VGRWVEGRGKKGKVSDVIKKILKRKYSDSNKKF